MTNLGTHIYDWIFHYNIYRDLWEAARRENYTQLFSGGTDVIRSTSLLTLVEIVSRTDGDTSKLQHD